MKACACGVTHTAAGWKALPLKGWVGFEGLVVVELRNCPCGSTIGIERPVFEVLRELALATKSTAQAGAASGEMATLLSASQLVNLVLQVTE